jgi:hypothetical protein
MTIKWGAIPLFFSLSFFFTFVHFSLFNVLKEHTHTLSLLSLLSSFSSISSLSHTLLSYTHNPLSSFH